MRWTLLWRKIATNIKWVPLYEENIVSVDGKYFGYNKLQSASLVRVFGSGIYYYVVTIQAIDLIQLCLHYFLHGPVPYFFRKILVSKVLTKSIQNCFLGYSYTWYWSTHSIKHIFLEIFCPLRYPLTRLTQFFFFFSDIHFYSVDWIIWFKRFVLYGIFWLTPFQIFFWHLFVSKVSIDSYHSIVEHNYHFPAAFKYWSIVIVTNQLKHCSIVSINGCVTASAPVFFHDPDQASLLLTSFMITTFILVYCSKVIFSRFAPI